MSVHFFPVQVRTKQLFFLLFLIASLVSIPSFAQANELPVGVLAKQTCGATTVSIHANGTGMLMGIQSLKISAEKLASFNVKEGCAVISWNTSAPAAVSVIFTELSNSPVTITLNESNFGYTYGTLQNNAGNAKHTAILSGLKPGTAYVYRIVSRAHPTAMPIISDARVLLLPKNTYQKTIIVTKKTSSRTPSAVKTGKIATNYSQIVPTATVVESSSNQQANTGTSDKNLQKTKNAVPAAIVATKLALGNISQEGSIWERITTIFNPKYTKEEAPESFHSWTYVKNRIVGMGLIFLLLLFLLYKYALPKIQLRFKNPIVVGMVIAALFTVLSAEFMMYYGTLVSIAIFLIFLAWYLLDSIAEDEEAHSETGIELISEAKQPKLLESIKNQKKDEDAK